jgi:hypothetical protein
MSLSRRDVRQLRSAGWEVIEDGPGARMRRVLSSLVSRRWQRRMVHRVLAERRAP